MNRDLHKFNEAYKVATFTILRSLKYKIFIVYELYNSDFFSGV